MLLQSRQKIEMECSTTVQMRTTRDNIQEQEMEMLCKFRKGWGLVVHVWKRIEGIREQDTFGHGL